MKTNYPKKTAGPEIVSVGGVTAKIYRSDSGGYRSFLVRYFVDGRPKSLRATSIEDARAKAKSALKGVSSGAAHVETFTPKEAAEIGQALDKLRKVNVPLLDAVSDYCSAKAILGAWSVTEAARAYLEMKKKEEAASAEPDPVLFKDAVVKFHARNEKRGLSDLYKRDCRKHLTILERSLGETFIQGLRKPELAEVLENSTAGGPRSFNNMRCTLNALFSFCQREGWLPREKKHEASLIEQRTIKGGAISIYTPDEMQTILANIGEELLPWVLLSGFAGLRTEEVWRVEWEAVRLDAGVITLDKAFTKTKRRRVIPIGDALRAWIESIPKKKRTGRIYDCPHQTFENRMRAAWSRMVDAKGKPLVPKRRNALRHSFGTYRFAVLKDEFKTSAEMGNSPSELREHYAELALPKDATTWFSIFPEGAVKITDIKEGAAA